MDEVHTVLAEFARKDATRYVVNAEYNRAFLWFGDNSFLELEHTSRSNRWAKPSAQGTTADRVCRSLRQFRLNAKHLQLFFDDGSDSEFVAAGAAPQESAGEHGTSR